MQGAHDHVMISLINDKVDDSKVYKSIYMKRPVKVAAQQATSNKCDRCSKTVYPKERLAVSGSVFHKTCFKVCSLLIALFLQ